MIAMRKMSWMIGFLGALLVFTPALADGSTTHQCEISVACCNASAGPCDLATHTCSCSYSCGPEGSSCSCSCLARPIKTIEPKLGLRVDLGTGAGMSLGGVDLNLHEVGLLLQRYFNWKVQVDTDVADNIVGDLDYAGTLGGLLDAIDQAAGTSHTVDENAGTITFHD